MLKLIFFKKATKIDEIFTVDLTLCSKCQIDGEDFVNFCGLLRKHELYLICSNSSSESVSVVVVSNSVVWVWFPLSRFTSASNKISERNLISLNF